MEVDQFFSLVLDKIEAHPRYSVLMKNAVAAQERLILNYHTHGAGQPYCVSVGVYDGAIALLELRGEYREIAHIRGIGKEASDCEPLMSAFAALLRERYQLRQAPEIELDGRPLAG